MLFFITSSSCTGGNDYSPITRTLTFMPTVVSQTVAVMIIDNNVVEPEENFEGVLSVAAPISRLTINPAIANVIIGDADSELRSLFIILHFLSCFVILLFKLLKLSCLSVRYSGSIC